MLKRRLSATRPAERLPSYPLLTDLMGAYQTDHLVGVNTATFRERIQAFLELGDAEMEGFQDPTKQRDLSIRFHWGHDHDFGDFRLEGSMGNRHLALLAAFIDLLEAIPMDLTGRRVLDVGSWTGGTSLLLGAMGAEVVAIEEVAKYVEALDYLCQAFGLTNVRPRNLSLYECTTPEFVEAFDVVFFAGVLYHVTDPVLALRITFDCLQDGGVCLVETASLEEAKRLVEYQGPTYVTGGDAKSLTRSGWSWFIPSPSTVRQMMLDVGFEDVRLNTSLLPGRALAVGRRREWTDMMRAGLSARKVP